MNTMSLFGAAPFPGTAWYEIALALSALIMATTLSPMPRSQARPIPVSLPLGCLFGLAAASVMAAIMHPELIAIAFSEA